MLSTKSKRKSNKELRKFAITMAIAFAIIAALFLWRKKSPTWEILFGISGFFLIFGLIVPQVIRPVEWVWVKLAFYLSVVMTHVLVTITFFVIFIPIGFIIKITGKDLLNLRFDKKADSYWISIESDGPSTRPEKPY